MQYIIDVLRIKDIFGNTEQHWHSVHRNLQAAMQEYALLSKDRLIIAAAVSTWQAGTSEPNGRVILGNYASRNCTGGIPTATLIISGSRSLVKSRLPITSFNTKARHYLALIDWVDTNGQGQPLSTQPSPGFRLKPTPRTENELAVFHAPHLPDEGRYAIRYCNPYNTYTTRKTEKEALMYLEHEKITEFTLEKIMFTEEQKQFGQLVIASCED